MVDKHILVQGFGRKQRQLTSSKKGLYLLKTAAQARRLTFRKSVYSSISKLILSAWHIK